MRHSGYEDADDFGLIQARVRPMAAPTWRVPKWVGSGTQMSPCERRASAKGVAGGHGEKELMGGFPRGKARGRWSLSCRQSERLCATGFWGRDVGEEGGRRVMGAKACYIQSIAVRE